MYVSFGPYIWNAKVLLGKREYFSYVKSPSRTKDLIVVWINKTIKGGETKEGKQQIYKTKDAVMPKT